MQVEVTVLHEHFRGQREARQHLRMRSSTDGVPVDCAFAATLDPDLLGGAEVRAVMQAQLGGGRDVGLAIQVGGTRGQRRGATLQQTATCGRKGARYRMQVPLVGIFGAGLAAFQTHGTVAAVQ